ncbi:MAG TPA: GNAT family N-acetyltransferase [Anaerolineae bacterium]|nr:GNAT family N-acetyltransferase [Anaerolineae bacterium]
MNRATADHFHIVTAPDPAAWADFVDQHPAGNIFHTPAMQAVAAEIRGWQPITLAALAPEDGRILALLPLVQTAVLSGPLRPLTSRIVAYGGALAEESEQGEAALAALLAYHNRRIRLHTLFTELRHQSDVSRWQPLFAEASYTWEGHLNYLIDLTPPADEIFARLSRSGRRNVRLAQRKFGLEVTEVTDLAGVEAFYQLLQDVYARARVPLTDRSLFLAAFRHLYPLGRLRIVLARGEMGIIAGRAALLYKDTVYDWYAGAHHRHLSAYPNDLLVWHLLSWGHEHGYHCFNFGGAGRPDEPYGVREFKAKFGGELVNYGRSVAVHSPLYRLATWAYRLYRRAM